MMPSRMAKTVVIHQPDFLSYLGFFHRFLHADLYIALDNVQFVKNTSRSWHNRDKIKTPRGEQWLTVPVQNTTAGAPINEILLSANSDWKNDHLNLLKENYRETVHFVEIFPYLQKLYELSCEKMMDFNLASIKMLLDLFDITIPIQLASALQPQGKSNDLLVDLLAKSRSDTYLSGAGAKAYFDPEPFERAGIRVVWQEFHHPIYPQLYGAFIPGLSSIDLLFNCGIEQSRQILRSA